VTCARLRVAAARHGRSLEAEVRAILQERLTLGVSEHGLGSRIQARFQRIEGDLQLPAAYDRAPPEHLGRLLQLNRRRPRRRHDRTPPAPAITLCTTGLCRRSPLVRLR
jgi:plasmid stability protein